MCCCQALAPACQSKYVHLCPHCSALCQDLFARTLIEKECMHLQVQVLSGLQHERIICLLGACLAPPHICIVEELANAGSLFNHLHGHKQGAMASRGMPYAQVGASMIVVACKISFALL